MKPSTNNTLRKVKACKTTKCPLLRVRCRFPEAHSWVRLAPSLSLEGWSSTNPPILLGQIEMPLFYFYHFLFYFAIKLEIFWLLPASSHGFSHLYSVYSLESLQVMPACHLSPSKDLPRYLSNLVHRLTLIR